MQSGSAAARAGADIDDKVIASKSGTHAEDVGLKRIASNNFGQTFIHCIAALCLFALSVTAHAQTTADRSQVQGDVPGIPVCGKRSAGDTRPRIGLALGGGGARGIAHISVLRELEALHIPIDCVAGTSMGSLVGGLFASGMSVDALEHLVISTDWDRLFDDTLERPERSFRRKQDDRDRLATIGVGLSAHGLKVSPGMLQGEKILALLERSTLPVSMIVDFNELPIPFRAIATDLNTGAAVVLDHGSLALSMRASMSLPGIFSPVEIDGRSLLDGGLANQVPIDVVRAMGADIVIAVDVGTPLARLDSSSSMLEVVSQLTGMMTTGNTRQQLATLTDRDVLIVPELGDRVATSDFGKGSEALAIGAQAATAKRGELERLSVPQSLYAASHAQPVLSADGVMVEFVRLDNTTRYADAFLLEQLHLQVGTPLDVDDLERRLLRIYSLGTVSTATYEVAQEDGLGGVIVHVTPKSQGPNYVQIGLSLDSDFAGTHNSALRAALLISPISEYGAEARFSVDIGSEPALKAEYYHPFDLANRYLSYSRIGYRNLAINAYDDNGNNVATYDVNGLEAEVRLAREFGNYGALSVGYFRATGNAKVQIGDPGLPRFDFDSATVDARAVVDRLDSLYFPRNGYYASLGYVVSRESLGADSDFDQVNFDALTAKSFGRNSVQFGVAYHSTLSGTLPIQARYRLGGRGRLAGFAINELTGQQYSYAVLGYTYQLAEIFGRSALIGTTFEYGNAWERREDMKLSDGIANGSLYAGFDSWLGPLSFGYGFREGGEGVLFLELGRPF